MGEVVIAGGGMAGLVTAVRAHELGARPTLYEKGDRLGGSMYLSSGVIWRHRDWEEFRRECPAGDAALQRLVWERLDDALDWLRRAGAPVVHEGTGNPRTTGARFDPRGLTAALHARLPASAVVMAPAPLVNSHDAPTVLATGGFAASEELVARYVAPAAPLRRRASPWSTGDGLEHGLEHGGVLSAGMDEFYGRNMPAAAWSERDYVPLAQLYAHHARIFDEDGVEFFRAEDISWSETNVVQATARRPGARAFYVLDRRALERLVRDETVAVLVDRAPSEARLRPDQLPFAPPSGTVVAVHVQASITHTIGGLRIDEQTRLVDAEGNGIDGLFAAGVDAGGVATGGYASGLAQALVLGLATAESAVTET